MSDMELPDFVINPSSICCGGERASPRQSTLVVAEDDRLTRDLLAEILASHGYIVEAVKDGQAAVERVERGGVDLVLLDILMPRLNGLDALRCIKSKTADRFLPVLLVTVKSDSASRIEGLKIGADDYICKPFDETELISRVDAVLQIKFLYDRIACARASLEKALVYDHLTGLYNYRYLHRRLAEEFKRAERYHDPLACIIVDIDRLQSLNEVGGRVLGDHVLIAVAEILRRCVRDVDVVARFGEDEFLLLLPSTNFAEAATLSEQIWRATSDAEFNPEGCDVKVTLSLGVGLFPSRDVRSKDALVHAADAALSQAKRDGRNRICMFQQRGHVYTVIAGTPILDV